MDLKELTKLRNSSDEKIVFVIDKVYRPYLMKIIKSVLETYSYMPESPESFYWLFLTKVPAILRDVKIQVLHDFDKIIAYYCRIFTKNHSRVWFAKAHQVLNRSCEFNDALQNSLVSKMEDGGNEEEESKLTFEHILPKLKKSDQKIFRLYFIEGKSYREIAMLFGISIYAADKKIKKLIILIKKII